MYNYYFLIHIIQNNLSLKQLIFSRLIPENTDDEGLKNAYEDADKHNWTKAELEAYDYALMREQDDRGRVTKVQKDIAVKLLKLGLPVNDITEATGLTNEEVLKLKRK